jgi:lipopolysaccharide/colanic/teichoic acid biosynthesis glycosyltransferase
MKIIIEISKGILVVAIIFIISPLLVFLTILSFLDTGKFPIFIQERGLTLNKYRFKIFKFRTIKDFPTKILINSNSNLKRRELLEYISPFGKFLRKSGLD